MHNKKKIGKKTLVAGVSGMIMVVLIATISMAVGRTKEQPYEMNQVLTAEAFEDEELQELLRENILQTMKEYFETADEDAILFSDAMLEKIAKAISERAAANINEPGFKLNEEEIRNMIYEQISKETMKESEMKSLITKEVTKIIESHNSTGADGLDGKDGRDGIDGADGQPGVNGRDGRDGKDGHTPVKGVDYFTQSDIAEIVKQTALKVQDSTGGNLSAADMEKIIEVVKDSILKDENIIIAAKDGKDGKDGYTPVKGIDYFTESEIEQLKSEIATTVFDKVEEANGGEDQEPPITEADAERLIEAALKAVNITLEDLQGRMDIVEKANAAQDKEISDIKEKSAEQDKDISGIKEKSAEQDKEISGIKEKNTDQDERLSVAEEKIEKNENSLNGVSFGQDENGNWGYRVGGADTVTPFNKGNATKNQVLAGSTFSSLEEGPGATGTMENYGGTNKKATTVQESGGNVLISIPNTGYYNTSSKISVPVETLKQKAPSLNRYTIPELYFAYGWNFGSQGGGRIIINSSNNYYLRIGSVSKKKAKAVLSGSNDNQNWTSISSNLEAGTYNISSYDYIKIGVSLTGSENEYTGKVTIKDIVLE